MYKIINKFSSSFLDLYSNFKSTNSLIQKLYEKPTIVFLMYHSIPDNLIDYPFITPKKIFKNQIEFLSKYFDIISIDKAFELITSNPFLLNKTKFVITFDDGYSNIYKNVFPLFEKHNLPFCIFLTTNYIENMKTFLNWNQVIDLYKSNIVTFGSHSINHANLKSLNNEDKLNELIYSKKIIEYKLGSTIKYFSYPSGGYDSNILKNISDYYSAAFKDNPNNYSLKNLYVLPRVSIDHRINATDCYEKYFLQSIYKALFSLL